MQTVTSLNNKVMHVELVDSEEFYQHGKYMGSTNPDIAYLTFQVLRNRGNRCCDDGDLETREKERAHGRASDDSSLEPTAFGTVIFRGPRAWLW